PHLARSKSARPQSPSARSCWSSLGRAAMRRLLLLVAHFRNICKLVVASPPIALIWPPLSAEQHCCRLPSSTCRASGRRHQPVSLFHSPGPKSVLLPRRLGY